MLFLQQLALYERFIAIPCTYYSKRNNFCITNYTTGGTSTLRLTTTLHLIKIYRLAELTIDSYLLDNYDRII